MSDEFDKIKIDPPMPKADDLQNVGDGLIDDLLGNTGIFGTQTKSEVKETEPVPESVNESEPESVSEPADEPVIETEDEVVSDSEPEIEFESEENIETVSEPVGESKTKEETGVVSEPVSEDEIEAEPADEIVPESVSESEVESEIKESVETASVPVSEPVAESESENILYRELLNGNQEYQVRGVSNSSQVRISDDDSDKNLKISGIIFEDFYERYKAVSRGEEIPQVVAVTAILHAALHSDRPFNSKYPNALRYAHEVLKDYAARSVDTDRDLIADFRRTTEEGIYAIESLVLLQFVNQYGADAWLRCRDLLTDEENRDMLRTFRKEIEKYGKAVRLKKLAGSKSVDI
jgi:PT repeat family protein